MKELAVLDAGEIVRVPAALSPPHRALLALALQSEEALFTPRLHRELVPLLLPPPLAPLVDAALGSDRVIDSVRGARGELPAHPPLFASPSLRYALRVEYPLEDAGVALLTSLARPSAVSELRLVVTYARPWFIDARTAPQLPPLDADLETFLAARALLTRLTGRVARHLRAHLPRPG